MFGAGGDGEGHCNVIGFYFVSQEAERREAGSGWVEKSGRGGPSTLLGTATMEERRERTGRGRGRVPFEDATIFGVALRGMMQCCKIASNLSTLALFRLGQARIICYLMQTSMF